MKLNIVVHEAEEGGYWAEVPSISVSEKDKVVEIEV